MPSKHHTYHHQTETISGEGWLVSDWQQLVYQFKPDPPGVPVDAQAQRHRSLGNDAQDGLETVPSACQMN